jgi:hypothetical protein
MHINFCDIWNSNTILFRWFKVSRLNWRTSCCTSLHGAAPSRCCADACGAAGGGLVSPPCQRGGPAGARQRHPAAPRGPARPKGLDLQIIFLRCYFKNKFKKKVKIKKSPEPAPVISVEIGKRAYDFFMSIYFSQVSKTYTPSVPNYNVFFLLFSLKFDCSSYSKN